MLTTWTLGCDATNPSALAEFWRNALGYITEPGFEDSEHGASIVDPQGKGPAIGFLAVPENKTSKNRMHIDIRIADGEDIPPKKREQLIRRKVDQVVAAGATMVRVEHYEDTFGHVVLLDPEGNEFCVA